MKKVRLNHRALALLLALLLLTAAFACAAPGESSAPASDAPISHAPTQETGAAPGVTAEEVKGVTIPSFVVEINGVKVSNQTLIECPVYSVQAFSVNSSGTESTCNYVGFAMRDVLAAVGISEGFTMLKATADDGYTVEVDSQLALEPTTLLAVSKDGEQFKAAPWFAPCSSQTTGDYLKGMVSITVDADATITPEVAGPDPSAAESASTGLPEILDRTDKVKFEAFSFLVNGQKVTNQTLEGLSIYKITVNTVNSKGVASESTYTGYQLADVLAACGITEFESVIAVANDGYETTLDQATAASDYTLLAIEKDKELGEDGTVWVAPGEATESKAYAKLVVEIKTA